MLDKEVCLRCCMKVCESKKEPFGLQEFNRDWEKQWIFCRRMDRVILFNLNTKWIQEDMEGAMQKYTQMRLEDMIEQCPYWLEHTVNA